MEKIPVIKITECDSFINKRHIFEQTILTLYNTQKVYNKVLCISFDNYFSNLFKA